MQKNDPTPVQRLIFELSKLPGIGEKTATRLAFFILKQDESYARALSEALVSARQKTLFCSECLTLTDSDLCRICADPMRDNGTLCVVERPADVSSIENAQIFKGRYHVLHGALSPLDGIGPEDLKIRELEKRIVEAADRRPILEIIFGNNPSVEGEATALYIAKRLKPRGLKLTQLAYGLPVGGRLEFTDRLTLGKALENRVELHS